MVKPTRQTERKYSTASAGLVSNMTVSSPSPNSVPYCQMAKTSSVKRTATTSREEAKSLCRHAFHGKASVMAEQPKLQPYAFEAAGYERVILGFPVWAGNVTPPIRSFIAENRNRLRNMTVSVTYEKDSDVSTILRTIEQGDVQIFDVDVERTESEGVPSAVLTMKLSRANPSHSALLSEVSGLDDFELICFLVIK